MATETVGRPMEILLVEDDILQARLTLEAVRCGDFCHRATPVRNGQDALDFLFRRGVFRRAPRPDLILLDLRLPKIDGLDVLAEIKADDELRSIPVVVLTASQDEEDRLICTEHAVEAFMSKPVDLEKFLDVLGQLKRYWRKDMVLPAALCHEIGGK